MREVTGFAFLEDDFFVLDVHSKVIGLFGERHRRIKVAPTALNSADLQRGLFSDRLILYPSRRELLEVVPGEHAVSLSLKVKREHRRLAEELVAQIRAWLDRFAEEQARGVP